MYQLNHKDGLKNWRHFFMQWEENQNHSRLARIRFPALRVRCMILLFSTYVTLVSFSSFNETQDMNYLTAEQADQIIKRKAWEQNEDLSKAFLAFDRDGNGIVTKKELKKVLYQFQIPVNKEEFKKLWDK